MLIKIKRFRESLKNKKLTKRDLVWALLLANVIIWTVAYNQTNKFYNDYLELLTKSLNQPAEASTLAENSKMTYDTKIIQTLRTEPPVGSKEWIKAKWEQAGADWSKVYAIMQCESRWDNNKYNINTNGTIDLGIYMFNSIHIPSRLSLECASDPICSTEKAIELYKEQGFTPWECAKILNIN